MWPLRPGRRILQNPIDMQQCRQLLMIRPVNFGYNAETAVNNAFQMDTGQVQEAALRVRGVTGAKVDLVFDPPWTPARMSDEAKLELNML